ncbi:hypothetical protein BH24GEM3_BH24GEM3_07720 [soil metagenome]
MASGKRFAPYPTSDRLSLSLSAFDDPTSPGQLEFEGIQRKSEIGIEQSVYDVSDRDWAKLTFRLETDLDPRELTRILPDTADPKSDAVVFVSLVCKSTKYRHGLRLRPSGEARWVGEAVVSRSDVKGTVQLHPMLVRTTRVPGKSGVPHHPGMILATGDPVALYTDPPSRLIEGAIEVRWQDFAKSKNDWREQHSSDVFHLEPYRDAPVLYLNEGHAQFRQLLENDSKRGADAALRDVTAAMIAQTTWTQLAVAALGEIVYDEESGEAELPGASWERDLLVAFLPRMYPSVADEMQVRRAAADFNASTELPALMARIGSAVQDLVRTSKHVEGAIRAYDEMREKIEEVQE